MASFDYSCVRVKQEKGSKDLVLFSASAIEIDDWVGIPQRLDLQGSETAGFQRTVSLSRETALRRFFAEDRNVIQNPLLCAIRQAPGIEVSFLPMNGSDDLGTLRVSFPDYEQSSLLDLITAARIYLEGRDSSLEQRAVPHDLVAVLQERGNFTTAEHDDNLVEPDDEYLDSDDLVEPAEEALFDESQISDFWDQLRAREELLVKLGDKAPNDSILGFSRQMLVSYLRPVILVDGQHRLRGAVLAAEDEVDNGEEAKNLILDGVPALQARRQLMAEKARKLPVSLLMDESPAEHVFQYVLVNQKATPVPRALLGTIISTSLAASELESIADRLEAAKIELQGSRIISILSRAEDSPFFGLVAKGLDNEGVKLQWSVLGSLADIFRYLQGGRYYHDTVDHAKTWRTHNLETSSIVQDWKARDFPTPYDYWHDLNGPWLPVFKAFWTKTRDLLANPSNPDAPNFWGNPRGSNIFNKPSLHILTADFFSYLRERKARLDSAEQLPSLVDDWLEYANKNYFARDWRLSNIKKDAVSTRKQWSSLWVNHRTTGDLPSPTAFVKPYKG